MKIGIVTINYPPKVLGGSHLSAYMIAKGLSKNEVVVDVFTSVTDSSDLDRKEWFLNNVNVHEIFDFSHYSNPIEEQVQTNKMKKILRNYLKRNNLNFDILFSYGMDTMPAILYSKSHAKKTAASINSSQWGMCPFFLTYYDNSECFNCNIARFSKCNLSRIFRKKISGSGNLQLIKILLSPIIWIDLHFKKKIMKQIDILLPLSKKIGVASKNVLNIKSYMPVCKILIDEPTYSKGKNEYLKLKKQLNIPDEKKLLIFPGRMIETKGVNTILKALRIISLKRKDFHMLFLGSGDRLDYAKSFVKQNNFQKAVSFSKFVPKDVLSHVYKNAYCTLYPSSFFEPLGRVPVESLINGTPVIGTNRGGLSESIINNKTGFVVRNDDPKDLSKKIQFLLDNPSLREKLSFSCIAWGQSFLLKNEIKSYLRAFHKVLAK